MICNNYFLMSHFYLFLSVCDAPEPPMQGNLTLSGDKTSVTFSCEPGYSINGQGSLSCLEDGGGWSGEVPTCCESAEEISCVFDDI